MTEYYVRVAIGCLGLIMVCIHFDWGLGVTLGLCLAYCGIVPSPTE